MRPSTLHPLARGLAVLALVASSAAAQTRPMYYLPTPVDLAATGFERSAFLDVFFFADRESVEELTSRQVKLDGDAYVIEQPRAPRSGGWFSSLFADEAPEEVEEPKTTPLRFSVRRRIQIGQVTVVLLTTRADEAPRAFLLEWTEGQASEKISPEEYLDGFIEHHRIAMARYHGVDPDTSGEEWFSGTLDTLFGPFAEAGDRDPGADLEGGDGDHPSGAFGQPGDQDGDRSSGE